MADSRLYQVVSMKDFISGGLAEPAHRMHLTLRLASAMCFIGHGVFGIITKPIWCNYFGVFGIGHDLAYRVMPVVGSIDILLGLSLLLYPIRVIPAWLVFWGAVTALLRPLSGESFGEFIERAGNFGAPLALLLLSGFRVSGERMSGFRNWTSRMDAILNPMLPRLPASSFAFGSSYSFFSWVMAGSTGSKRKACLRNMPRWASPIPSIQPMSWGYSK